MRTPAIMAAWMSSIGTKRSSMRVVVVREASLTAGAKDYVREVIPGATFDRSKPEWCRTE